jgi:(E)-4-hydroxy-3-methyl-but-2-enyl pyrophosphate reductase
MIKRFVKDIEIRLAETAGFCMGVRRAVDMVLDLAQHKGDRKIYTYGPLIHNPQTVELLKKRGIVPVASLDEIGAAGPGTRIIIRAHGISPQERRRIKERGFRILDATCPRVGRVQAIIKKHAARDFTVLIVGDEEHPEVNGLLGYTAGRGIVITPKGRRLRRWRRLRRLPDHSEPRRIQGHLDTTEPVPERCLRHDRDSTEKAPAEKELACP